MSKNTPRCGGCNDCCECLSALPEGKTCNDCAHVYRCTTLFGQYTYEKCCQWIPSRFLAERGKGAA